MLETTDYPVGLYRSYFEHLDEYNDFYLVYRNGQDLTEDEKKAGDEICALLGAIKNVQIRETVNGRTRCINGFSEALMKEAKKILDTQEARFREAIGVQGEK